ncbi:MAG TPA: phage holin family protein [Gemmatimonadaceae bacterium]|jgi:uncharacterized membrane protein YqjE|nr:phage holin family protein [Gemmatimonadaceae bacterium]
MGVQRMPVDPNAGIPDLVSRLGEDSKRLMRDEVQLAKLELRDSMHRSTRGGMWLGVAFGIGVVALVALTLLATTLIGRLAAGHMWIGALVTGVVELVVAWWLFKRGVSTLGQPSYSLEQTRKSITNSF